VSFPPSPSPNPTHALATAMLNHKPEWASLALEQGADIFAKGRSGETLLAEALTVGLRAAKSKDKSISGRIFAEGQVQIAALLREHSRTQPIERFSLFDAVVARNFASIQHNLDPARLAQSDVNDYRKALAHAVQEDDAEIIKLLLSVERFSLSDAVNAGNTAAVRSAMQRAPLAESNADEYHRSLIAAVRQDNSAVVELLLAAGVSPNAHLNCPRDDGSGSPLLTSATYPWNGWPLLTFAAAQGSTAAMRALLKAGADPNATADTTAALHGPFFDGAHERGVALGKRLALAQEAAKAAVPVQPDADPALRQIATLRALSEAIASMPLVDPGTDYASYVTPLMIAATSSNLDAVKLLVQGGADLGAKDKRGRTALTYAKEAKFKRVVAYLEKAYEQRDAAGELTLLEAVATGTVYRIKALLEAGADREQRDEQGQTPLMLAAAAGHVEVVKMLCAAGANVHAMRNDGGDLWTCAFTKPKAEIIGTLIEHGLSPNQPRKTAPALLLAFGLPKPKEILKLMLDNGADLHATVPAEVVETAARKHQKSSEFLKLLGARVVREIPAAKHLKGPSSVLEFAKHFASRDVYYALRTHAGVAGDSHEFVYEHVREALKQCAELGDEKFKAEAARIAAILRAKPTAWKRRKGVVHYMSALDKALSAHYGESPAEAAGEKVPLQLLQRLQAEVAGNGYTLVYTGLVEGSLQRLLLFPLNEPLAAIAACGTNAANHGHDTRDVVNWCAETRRTHPLTVLGVGFDFMDLGFEKPIQNSEKLATRIAEFCPDLQVAANDSQAVAKFARELAEGGRCFFWWD